MATQTTVTINSGTGALATKPQAFYDKMLLELRRQKTFYHQNLAQQRPMPRNAGDTIQFRKITGLAPALTPLTEGVTPVGNTAGLTAIKATTVQYGDFIEFSDVVDFQQVDDVLKEYTREQGFQANETLDTLTRDELALGSNVFYAGAPAKTSRATLAAGDIPTMKGFRKVILQMEKDKVRPAMDGMYVAIISPSVAFDLMDDPDFQKMMQYSMNATNMVENKIGDLFGIRFMKQINAKSYTGAGAGGVNVHASVILGNQAYGITKIAGEGDIKNITKALGSSGTSDPLNQRQTIGWKVNAFVAKRLDEVAIARYESVPVTG